MATGPSVGLAIVVVDAFVVRTETDLRSRAWLVVVVLPSVVFNQSTCGSARERLGFAGGLRVVEWGTLIPILERISAATSWARSGRLPVAAADPVTVATVRPPAARSALALRGRRTGADLSVLPSAGQRARNKATAARSPWSSASVAGARAAVSTPTSGR